MRRAVSLPEAVLVGLVLALVVMVLAQLYPLTVLTLGQGERRLHADQWAESLLDEWQAQPFTALPAGQERRLALSDATYSGVVRAFQPAGTDPSTLKALQVEVTWAEKGTVRRVMHERWIVDLSR